MKRFKTQSNDPALKSSWDLFKQFYGHWALAALGVVALALAVMLVQHNRYEQHLQDRQIVDFVVVNSHGARRLGCQVYLRRADQPHGPVRPFKPSPSACYDYRRTSIHKFVVDPAYFSKSRPMRDLATVQPIDWQVLWRSWAGAFVVALVWIGVSGVLCWRLDRVRRFGKVQKVEILRFDHEEREWPLETRVRLVWRNPDGSEGQSGLHSSHWFLGLFEGQCTIVYTYRGRTFWVGDLGGVPTAKSTVPKVVRSS